ncbi:carboxypeptidase-like regulatory domain-containing protein [Bacteroidota bacterium]
MRDVIKYCFLFLFLISLPGKAQPIPDTLKINLPDTSLSIPNTLFFIEGSASVYFSYNPEIFKGDLTVEWTAGVYTLQEILDHIWDLQDITHTRIGNQIVLYPVGESPPLPPDTKPTSSEPKLTRIRGRIISKSDEEALAYSTIWLPKTWEGTIANTEGYFTMILTEGHIADTIAISCMGYETRRIPISELNDTVNTIYLQTSLIPIQEVVIRRTNPIYLLRLALSKIPENNSKDPVIETAFYRETIQKSNTYISVSEAVVDVYKPGYESVLTEQVKVLLGRKNIDYTLMDTVMVKLRAGLETSYLLDIIRYRPEFLIEDFFKKYEYRMADVVVIQDNLAYAIDFNQKAETDPPHYRGRIYIDLNSFALRGVEFDVDPQTISSLASSMIHRKPRKMKVRPLSASYMVYYKSDGNLYHISMIRADNRFRIRPTKKLFGTEFRAVSEMAVTALRTESVERFRSKETANPKDIFTEMLGGYDPDFWGPYNYIIPDETLEEALIRIGRLMGNQTPEE